MASKIRPGHTYTHTDRGSDGWRPMVPESQKRVLPNANGTRQERRKAARAAAKRERQSGG